MRKKLYQPNHLVIFGSYNNLGLMQRGPNQPEINELESDHSELGDSILNLGIVFERCSELREAAYNYHQALEIYAKHYPVNHHLCQTAEECLKRVSQQVDLNYPSLNRYENFKARIWSSMKKNFRRSMILNNSFAGSFFKRELCRI